MSTGKDEFARPEGVAEWIGTVVGLLLGVALAVVGVTAMLAFVSAVVGLLILPVVLLADEPWWWAWVIGAGPIIGMLLLAGVALTVGHLRDRRKEAVGEGRPLEERGPAWRLAEWGLDHRRMFEYALWPGLPIALLIYAAVSWEIWPVVLAGLVVANPPGRRNRVIYAGLLAALLGYAAVSGEVWWAIVVVMLLLLDVMEIAARKVADAHRRPTARR